MREAVLKSKNPRDILKEIEEIEKQGELDYTFPIYQSCLVHEKHVYFFVYIVSLVLVIFSFVGD